MSAAAPDAASGSFAELGVPAALVASLAKSGVDSPFPIQAAILPDALSGRNVLGRAATGTGKTIAFAVPMIAKLASDGHQRRPKYPAGLILVPTRELAVQVSRTLAPLASAAGLSYVTIYGGVPQGSQTTALRRGVDVVVATPGRLEDLMGQGYCRLDQVSVTAVDEADQMADLGFLPALRRLLDATPADGQRLLFSATLDEAISGLARQYLPDSVSHSIDPPPGEPVRVDHHLFTVAAGDKAAVVAELASGRDRSLLFTRTRHGAQKLARQLSAAGIPAVDLHGDLSQSKRERNLAAFAKGKVGVLVATDVAARGIHVEDIALVVHVDPPAEHKSYVHRSGRTARAGATGKVVTIVSPQQARSVNAMLRRAEVRPESGRVAPGDDRIRSIVGPAGERRYEPQPQSPPQPAARPGGFKSGGSRSGGFKSDGSKHAGSKPYGARQGGPRRSGPAAHKPAGARRSWENKRRAS